MGKFYLSLFLTFVILVIIHVAFAVINLYHWATNSVEVLVHGKTFIDTIYYSIYLKWILLADAVWLLMLSLFLIRRKSFKTDPKLHYLSYKPIQNPKICVIIPTYNEELIVESVVMDYIGQKNVSAVLVIDNHSTDRTAEIAERSGAKVIRKPVNKGLAHSCVMGMREFLKTDANILVITECDGTFSGYDIGKMLPYLDNCDMVIGTRQVQVLTEKGNQNSTFYVWGNYFLAKLIQIKYFSLSHLGIVELTDVGCIYRCIRREALEKIIDKLTHPGTDEVIVSSASGLIAILITMIGIENNLKIVEVPVTFKKRVGVSKTGADKKSKATMYGLRFMWYILTK